MGVCKPRLVLVWFAMLACCCEATPRVLFLVRHAVSFWNAADKPTRKADCQKANDLNLMWSQRTSSDLTDTALTPFGVGKALQLCQAIANANGDSEAELLCERATKDLLPTDWKPKRNALRKQDQVLDEQYSRLLSGKTTKRGKFLVTSMVRTIDSLFFELMPYILDNTISEVTTVAAAQEIGSDCNGFMFLSRLACNGRSWHPSCARVRHPIQLRALESAANSGEKTLSKYISGDANEENAHKRYYDSLVPFPNSAEFYKYQLEELRDNKLRDEDMHTMMFQDFFAFLKTIPTDYAVLSGHGDYTGKMLTKFHGDNRCKQFGKAKLDNTSVWRVEIDENGLWVNCRILYGGFLHPNEHTNVFVQEDVGGDDAIEKEIGLLEEMLGKI